MPFGRRAQEPSPRLLALLAESGRPWASLPDAPGAEQPDDELAWVPQRKDIDIGASEHERGSGSTGWLERSRGMGGNTSARGPSGRHRRPRGPAPPMLGLPESIRSARFGAPAPALMGVAIVLALAVVVFGVRVAWAKADSRPSVVSPNASQRPSAFEHGGTTSPALLPASATASGGRAGQVVVHVVGQGRRPGVVTLPAGSRVAAAVQEA